MTPKDMSREYAQHLGPFTLHLVEVKIREQKMRKEKMEGFCTFPPFGTQEKTERKQKSGMGPWFQFSRLICEENSTEEGKSEHFILIRLNKTETWD